MRIYPVRLDSWFQKRWNHRFGGSTLIPFVLWSRVLFYLSQSFLFIPAREVQHLLLLVETFVTVACVNRQKAWCDCVVLDMAGWFQRARRRVEDTRDLSDGSKPFLDGHMTTVTGINHVMRPAALQRIAQRCKATILGNKMERSVTSVNIIYEISYTSLLLDYKLENSQ